MPQKTSRPPTPLARFIAAMRHNYQQRLSLSPVNRRIFSELRLDRNKELTRNNVAEIAAHFAADEDPENFGEIGPVSTDFISNFEKGRQKNPDREKLYWILRGLFFSDLEANSIIENENFMSGVYSTGVGNGHLINSSLLDLLVGEFGPRVADVSFPIDAEYRTTWIQVSRSELDGYRPNEVALLVDLEGKINPPNKFESDVKKLEQRWIQLQNLGKKAPFNGETLALTDVVPHSTADNEERNLLYLHFRKSKYSRNVVAKGELGESYRWQALQEFKEPYKPEDYLASGVGIAVCLFCDQGNSIVIGHRSTQEQFRSNEYDCAVVEGIRPNVDLIDSAQSGKTQQIDIYTVLNRAIDEEMGIKDCLSNYSRQSKVFEFGIDLKYYQWNFLSYVDLNMSFDELLQAWSTAKHRRENQKLLKIKNDYGEAVSFIKDHEIWSCGAACILKSIELFRLNST